MTNFEYFVFRVKPYGCIDDGRDRVEDTIVPCRCINGWQISMAFVVSDADQNCADFFSISASARTYDIVSKWARASARNVTV